MEYVVADADDPQFAVVKSQTELSVVPRQYWAAFTQRAAAAQATARIMNLFMSVPFIIYKSNKRSLTKIF